MSKHLLKTVQPYYGQVESGLKTFECRKNDRDFEVGDYVNLVEYDPNTDTYTGKFIEVKITYILKKFAGLHGAYCIFSFVKLIK